MISRWAAALALAAWAVAAGAQDRTAANDQPRQANTTQRKTQATASASRSKAGNDELRSACADMVRAQARRPQASAERSLAAKGSPIESACADMIKQDAQASIQRGEVAPGREVRASMGQNVGVVGQRTATEGNAIQQAGSELLGLRQGRPADVTNTLTTDPVGLFGGEGVNAQLSHVYNDDISLIAQGRFSRTNAMTGSLTVFGFGVGFDYYLLGGRNQGLRVGPRADLDFGRDNVTATGETFTRLGIAGEVGYNWVASNGISAMVGGGLDLRLAGALQDNVALHGSGDLSPYLRLGVGYSW